MELSLLILKEEWNKVMYDLPIDGEADSYEFMRNAVKLVPNDVPGLTCEIGVRRGGGTYHILEALREKDSERTHICVDPYGNILYSDNEGVQQRDYTNNMRNETLPNLYNYASEHKLNILFYNLEDSEFFNRFSDGVPIYDVEKKIVNEYAFVHIDGQHDLQSVMKAAVFFGSRMSRGGIIAFDNVNHYPHDSVDRFMLDIGYQCIGESHFKRLYVRT